MKRITNILRIARAAIRKLTIHPAANKNLNPSQDQILLEGKGLLLPLSREAHVLLVSEALSNKYIQALKRQLGGQLILRQVPANQLKQWIQWQQLNNVLPSQKTFKENPSVHKILSQAYELGASDCYIEFKGTHYKVFYRVQGGLTPAEKLSVSHGQPLLMSLLILAHLNLDKTNRPQEGHFQYKLEESLISCRLSYIASPQTQSLVMRLFYDKAQQFTLTKLGITDELLNQLKQTLQTAKSGLILISGPTGSGKTTTLYSLLSHLAQANKKIISLEDPIESEIPGVVQSEINEPGGYQMPIGLKSILRQDPDVIAIGEIRDKQTAQCAFYACLSGYLVLTTLHAKSLEEVPFRCSELGINMCDFYANMLYVIHQTLQTDSTANNGQGSRRAHFSYQKYMGKNKNIG